MTAGQPPAAAPAHSERVLNAATLLLLLGLVLTLRGCLTPAPADATPLYAAREGRTCDNCHVTPNGWVNPPLAERKCTMSCQSCHVDPAGGGLRNGVGRFFGRSTLPMIATSPRPTDDWDREIAAPLYRLDHATTYSDSLPLGPNDYAASLDPKYDPRDRLWALGRPLGGPSRFATFRGRLGALNPDPLLRVGWDARVAGLVGTGSLVFPMQADLEAALHPVEHLRFVATVGARGRAGSWSESFSRPDSPYLRQGYVMLDEAPFLGYLRAGRFTPEFGLRLDDHTALTRRTFDLDDALPDARMTGIELGVNPNRPYARVAWLRGKARGVAPKAFDIFDVDPGHAFSANVGYREVNFSVGLSGLAQRRALAQGGDATSYGINVAFNPWYYSKHLPLTWQAEADFGDYRRASGRKTRRAAFYQELDWLAGNGVNLLVAQDWADPDRQVKDDESWRLSGGVQVTPIPGITLDTRLRLLFPRGAQSGADFFVQLHFWN